MIEGILIGLKTALSFQNLMMVMIGCFAGTIIGMLPGLGPMTAIACFIFLMTEEFKYTLFSRFFYFVVGGA